MRIGIDVRFLNQSGIGRYIKNLLFYLQKLDKENEYFIFLLKQDWDFCKLNGNFTKILADFGWYGVLEQVKFPPLLKKYNFDLVHFPHFNTPVFYEGKFVVTVHDLIHQNFKMLRATTLNPLVYSFKQIGYNKVFSYAVKKSQKIISPSNFVKSQLITDWKVPGNKVFVTHEGVDSQILKINSQISKHKSLEIVRKLKVLPPYIFYAGNAHPHKNVEGLIEAFLILRKKYQYLQLVLSGNDHYFWKRIRDKYPESSKKHLGDIRFTGFVSDEQLVSLYKNASCFVMPSFEEGFGIPLLEAFACGCPVVSSNAGSLPEVGGSAANYFNPKNPIEMSEKIMETLNNPKIRRELIEKGVKRHKKFSWEKMAGETLTVYKSV